jgi:hypothetical protein
MITTVPFFNSCKKESPAFDYEASAGIWVSYGYINEPGRYQSVSLTANSLFGSYAESVQLNADKTFIPVTWFHDSIFTLKHPEAGTFHYLPGDRLKFTGGLFDFECRIIKFEENELWLKMFDAAYKFRRQ